jgi:preprotein translocase subunit SecD
MAAAIPLLYLLGMLLVMVRSALIALCLFGAPPSNAEEADRIAYLVIEPSLDTRLSAETAQFFTDVLRYGPDPARVRDHRIGDGAITLVLQGRDVARAMAILSEHERQIGGDEFIFEPSRTEIEIRLNPGSQRRLLLIERVEEAARAVLPTATITRPSTSQLLITATDIGPDALRARIEQSSRLGLHLVLDAEPADADIPEAAMVAPAFPGVGQYDEVVLRQPDIDSARFALIAVSTDVTGRPVVDFRLDSQGARQLCHLTRDHLRERFAVLLNGKVLTAPVIIEPICGGAGQISGAFDEQVAHELVALMRAGVILSQARVVETGTGTPALR